VSLILQALTRSDREQQQGDIPGLSTPIAAASGDFPWPLIAAALGALCVVLAFILWRVGWLPADSPNATAQEVTPMAEHSPSAAGNQPTLVPQRSALAAAAKKAPVTVSEQANKAVEHAIEQLYSGDRFADVSAQQITATERSTINEQLDAADDPQPVDVDELLARAQRQLSQRRKPDEAENPHAGTPFITGMSQQHRDAIATIYYTHHDYSDKGANSVVMNKRTLTPGDQVVPGVTLVEILRDSALLEFRGKQFRLRALNSWVNL